MKPAPLILPVALMAFAMLPQAQAAVILDPFSTAGDFGGTAGTVGGSTTYSGGWFNASGRNIGLKSNTATGRPAGASDQYIGNLDHRKLQRLDLGYTTVGTGEQYDISFYTYADSASFDHGEDYGEFSLFYTSNNSITGTVVDSIVLQGFTGAGVWTQTTASSASFSIDPGAGKNLFLSFLKQSTGSGDGNLNDENIGLDHVSIFTTPVPEPGLLLLGAVSWLMLLRRRR